jgi:putative membrane protein
MTVFVIVGSIFVLIAALLHIFIFFMESVLWTKPSTYGRFGVKNDEEAAILKPMAFNQGFYNLFLAIGAGVGLVLLGAGQTGAGAAISLFAVGSMLLAAVVLVASNPKMARAAALQGTAPLIGVVFLILALVTA